MSSFHDVRFPTGISRRASGGPERRTDVVVLASGREERNSRWADSRRRYNAGYGIRTLDEIHEVIRFFKERRGRLHAFRWKDHADFKSCAPQQTPAATDQEIGTGDGSTTEFQLVKRYGAGAGAYVRTITKPVGDTVLVALDGVLQTAGSDCTIDATTGAVTFAVAPGSGVSVTAGYEFDVPARFDSDVLTIDLSAVSAGQIPEFAVIEVKE